MRLKRRMGRAGSAAFAVVAAGLCSAAAVPAPIPLTPAATPISSDESTVVQELEVVAHAPGPALWRVTRGDAVVTIVGGLSPIPHSLQWNTIRVDHALAGATVLFVPPRPHAGLFDMVGLAFKLGRLKPSGGRVMEDGLSPPLKVRFERVAASFKADPAHYAHWKPAVAGYMLVDDFRRAAGLSSEKPETTVIKLAKARHAEVRTVGSFKVAPVLDSVTRLSDQANQACLSAALDDVEREAAHARPAADAWAAGDLETVRKNYGQGVLDSCLLSLPSIQAVIEHGTADAVTTINAALNRPGKSVAVIDLAFLLRPNGVLDRLRASGDQITVPPE